MSSNEFCNFFNNKELFTKWFLDEELGKETVNNCRHLMDEEIFNLNWRTSMGVTVDWIYARRYLAGAHIVKDPGRFKSVFLDFMNSSLMKGCENKPENYNVVVYNDSVNKLFYLPHTAIMTFWSAGWPRHGWNPGRYVTEPRELLKPIRDFLDGKFSYEKLLGITEYEKYSSSQKVFDFTYSKIYPFLRNNRLLFTKHEQICKLYLEELYEKAVGINKEQFKSAYRSGNMFTGPLEETFPFALFDDPEQMKNPFLRYYKKLRTEHSEQKES